MKTKGSPYFSGLDSRANIISAIRAGTVKLTAAIIAACCFFSAVQAEEPAGDSSKWHAGLHGSTAGLGGSLGLDFHEKFGARIIGNQFNYDYEETDSGNDYKGDLELSSYGAALDWYVFGGGFRLSGGGFLNNNKISARTTGEVDIGGITVNNAALNLNADFDSFAPYVGVGWMSGRGKKGWGFHADLGVYYQNLPKLTASGNIGDGCTFTVSENSNASSTGCAGVQDLNNRLENEHRDLKESIDLKWYPVAALGVIYRF